MQKNSVSLKEVLTRVFERVSRGFADSTPVHSGNDADSA
jgi:hypothetical protein